jgi:two-component system response regulator AtoC
MDAYESAQPTTEVGDGTGASRSRVLLVLGDDHCGTYPLSEGRTLTVGRDADSDVPLLHPQISRRHARIHAGPIVEVEDLGSKNGTLVGGSRVKVGDRRALSLGVNLQLGPYLAVVVEHSPAADSPPQRAAVQIVNPTPAGVPGLVARIAAGMVNVLITGETGVGKEVLARTIHGLSGRAGQFVAINCASLSEALLENELFGHERGAFTGATTAKPGLFEMAGGGTVFLDELGEVPHSLQAKLLRVLETRSAYRVGGVRPVGLDVRFIAATHKDLTYEVKRGSFRRDLYYRVNGIMLEVRPLRARRSAIPALAAEFLANAVALGALPILTQRALDALVRHDWPGNVRELRTVVERAALLCEGGDIDVGHILIDLPPHTADGTQTSDAEAGDGDGERDRIVAALEACGGNQTRAARRLGIARSTFVQRLALHRIVRPRMTYR